MVNDENENEKAGRAGFRPSPPDTLKPPPRTPLINAARLPLAFEDNLRSDLVHIGRFFVHLFQLPASSSQAEETRNCWLPTIAENEIPFGFLPIGANAMANNGKRPKVLAIQMTHEEYSRNPLPQASGVHTGESAAFNQTFSLIWALRVHSLEASVRGRFRFIRIIRVRVRFAIERPFSKASLDAPLLAENGPVKVLWHRHCTAVWKSNLIQMTKTRKKKYTEFKQGKRIRERKPKLDINSQATIRYGLSSQNHT